MRAYLISNVIYFRYPGGYLVDSAVQKVTDYIIEKVSKEEQIVSVKELKELFDNI